MILAIPLFNATLSASWERILLLLQVFLPMLLILGLFILGFYAIKHYIYDRLSEDVQEKVSLWLFLIFFLLFLCVYSGAGPVILW